MAKRVEIECQNQLDYQMYFYSTICMPVLAYKPHSRDNKERIDTASLLKKM